MFKIQFEIKSKMTAYVWAISGYVLSLIELYICMYMYVVAIRRVDLVLCVGAYMDVR